jgi:hypothetical protein
MRQQKEISRIAHMMALEALSFRLLSYVHRANKGLRNQPRALVTMEGNYRLTTKSIILYRIGGSRERKAAWEMA